MNSDTSNPYVGLRPFERDDSQRFFGRREQTMELLELLHRSHFLAVVGSSGCGKSSLIRAGLIPALLGGFLVEERDEWRIAEMRPGDSPRRNLATALCRAVGDGSAADGDASELFQAMIQDHTPAILERLVPRIGQQANLLLLVDQFEEVFSFRGMEELVERGLAKSRGMSDRKLVAADFVDLLTDLGKRSELSIYTVITMRTDFLGDCDIFYGLPEAMNRGRYLVPRLTRQQLRQVIEGPALLAGAQIAPRLLDHLLNELGDRTDRLPILQHALLRTWEYWQRDGGHGPLDFEHYRAAGTLDEALSRHAEEALRQVDLKAAERIFKRLTDTDSDLRRVRSPAVLSELAAVSGLRPQRVERLLERFIEGGRYFVWRSQGTDPRYDISHESLIRQWGQLRQWVDDERLARDKFGELVRGARRYDAKKAGLLRNPELQIAADWQKATWPTQAWARRYSWQDDDLMVATKYVDRSRAAERRRKLLKRRAVMVGAFAAAVAIVILLVLNVETGKEKEQALKDYGVLAGAAESVALVLEEDISKLESEVEERESELKAAEQSKEQEAEPARRAEEIASSLEGHIEKLQQRKRSLEADTRQLIADKERMIAEREQLIAERETLKTEVSGLRPYESFENARGLINQADGLAEGRRFREAEAIYRQALKRQETLIGRDDFACGLTRERLGDVLWRQQNRATEAEAEYRLSLTIVEKHRGSEHPTVARILSKLGRIYRKEGEYVKAEDHLLRSLGIREQILGPKHRDVARSLQDLADLYRDRDWILRAEELEVRVRQIEQQRLGAAVGSG